MNPETNKLPHSIDFHASLVAWNDEMRSINPGEELVYEFVAKYAGVYMYHCGTTPALHHIANGMFGMIIVEPDGGLAPVDARVRTRPERVVHRSSRPASISLEKASAAAPAPDVRGLERRRQPVRRPPDRGARGRRSAGLRPQRRPEHRHSFHVVGTIFHEVIKEGVHLTEGNEGNWGSQAVDLSPAQGAIVEMRFDEDGLYPIVTHAFNFVGRGALGLFQAGDGGPAAEGGH